TLFRSFRNAVQTSCGHLHIFCHRTIDAITKSFPGRIQVIQPCPAHGVVGIDDSRSFTDHTFAQAPSFDSCTYFDNFSPKFMTEHYGVVYWPAVVSRPLMQVASAHPDIFYL